MNQDPWKLCPCGHLMLLHDAEDSDGGNPLCCVDGCDQARCGDRLDVSRLRALHPAFPYYLAEPYRPGVVR